MFGRHRVAGGRPADRPSRGRDDPEPRHALPGPEPLRRGRRRAARRDHPILARVAETDTCAGALLRPGYTSFGAADAKTVKKLVSRTKAALTSKQELIVRIDAAGDCAEILETIANEGASFVAGVDDLHTVRPSDPRCPRFGRHPPRRAGDRRPRCWRTRTACDRLLGLEGPSLHALALEARVFALLNSSPPLGLVHGGRMARAGLLRANGAPRAAIFSALRARAVARGIPARMGGEVLCHGA